MSNNSVISGDIFNNLTPVEEKILLECGKMHISVKKNISEETLKKKMPNDFMDEFTKSLRHLISKGLLVVYRPHNYGLSKKGRIIAKLIKDRNQKELYSNMRILMLME